MNLMSTPFSKNFVPDFRWLLRLFGVGIKQDLFVDHYFLSKTMSVGGGA